MPEAAATLTRLKRTILLLVLIGSALLAAGCASDDPTTGQLPVEETSSEASAPDEEVETDPAEAQEETSPAQGSDPISDDGQPAVAEGFVFEDLNNNSRFDVGEPGLTGLSIVAQSPEGQRLVATTDNNGYFRFEEPAIQHRIFVNTGFFPETFALTTEFEFYDTSVSPGDTRSELNFGYRDRELSSIIGTVYDDLNGNGLKDEDEPGIDDVTVRAIAHVDGLGEASDRTDKDGRFRFDFSDIDHEVMVDESTLPAGYVLSSERDVFPLFVPTGFAASDINFGYRSGSD